MDTARITGLLAVAAPDPHLLQKMTATARFLLKEKYPHNRLLLHETPWCSLFLLLGQTAYSRPDNTDYLQGIHFYHDDPPHPRSGHYLQVVLNQSGCLLRNDPVGLVNLYSLMEHNITIFGTSSMDLACLARDFQPDEQGMLEFLTVGYPLLDHTFYHNISLMPAGYEWRLRQDTLPGGVWTRYSRIQQTMLDQHQGIRTLDRELSRAADDMATIGHPCCDLTGGFDSRGILCGFLQAGTDFSTVVNGPPMSPDVLLADRIAKKFGLNHHWNNSLKFPLPQTLNDVLAVLHLTDGEIEFSEYYHTCLIHRRTAQKERITVNGSGGELFRGYWWEGEWPGEGGKTTVNKPYLLKRILLPGQNLNIFSMDGKQICNMLKSRIEQILDEQDNNLPDGQKIDHLYLRFRMERWLARYYSSTSQILPCCSPFLAAPVLSVALSLRPELKKRNHFFKAWLTQTNRKLASMPTDNGTPALPLSPATAPYYWRYPVHLMQKAGSRFGRKLKTAPSPAPISPLLDRFFQLVFAETDIREFLAPKNMVSSVLFSRPVVSWQRKKQIDRQKTTLPSSQLARIVTLELTLRQVLECRQRIRQDEN